MNLTGKDAQMAITAYKDEGFSSKITEIKLPFRPSSLKVTLGNRIEGPALINASSGTGKFQGMKSSRVDVTFYLESIVQDTMLGLLSADLDKTIKKVLNAFYTMNDDTHETSFLLLKWAGLPLGIGGEGGFYCRLDNLDLEYTQVSASGKPLVAQARCTFVESLSEEVRKKREGKNSPDLTHIRLVNEQDSLAWKTWDIYKNPGYMVSVARANNLDSLRSIEPGQSLIFPPLEK